AHRPGRARDRHARSANPHEGADVGGLWRPARRVAVRARAPRPPDLSQLRGPRARRAARTPQAIALRASAAVIHGLDVVAVGVEHERAVVPLVIVRPEPGRAVVTPPGGERCLVERIDLFAIARDDRHVNFLDFLRAARVRAEPELRLAFPSEASNVPVVAEERDPERRERLLVEGLGAAVITHLNAHVIDDRHLLPTLRRRDSDCTRTRRDYRAFPTRTVAGGRTRVRTDPVVGAHSP